MVVMTIILFIVLLAVGGLWGCPQYNVYSQQMAGKAQLAEAMSNRQIKTLEAKQHMESAQFDASAEITRAKGAEQANTILQNSLGGPAGYLRYLQIQALENSHASLIYVPTENGLPITEGRRLADDKQGQ